MKFNIFSLILGRLFGKTSKHSSIIDYDCGRSSSTINVASESAITDKEEQQEATNVFNSQTTGFNKSYSVHRVVGQVLWSNEDTLDGNGNVSSTYTVTPLHAFDDQAGHGDYYLVNATYTIANANMYHPNHKNWHGGVQVRIGGFCLSQCEIESSIYCGDSKIDGMKLFSSSPKPETVIDTHTYTVSDSWNIGGSITGGVKGGVSEKGKSIEGNGSLTFNWGIGHSKTDTYSVSDLNVKNNSDWNTAKFTLENRNVVDFDWGCDNGLKDCAEFAKSSLIFHATWIWYLPNVVDVDNSTQFTIKTIIKPTYKSCRFYSTKADYDEWFDSIVCDGESKLELPNRQASGYVELKNDTNETITNVTFYNKDKDGDIAYRSQSSFEKNTVAKFCLPVGTFFVTFEKGKTAEEKKTYLYKKGDNFELARGNTVNLVGSFDFVVDGNVLTPLWNKRVLDIMHRIENPKQNEEGE